jgi:hypothetical protein
MELSWLTVKLLQVLLLTNNLKGKTHSMMGFNENDPGVIPQAVDDVFSFIREVFYSRRFNF